MMKVASFTPPLESALASGTDPEPRRQEVRAAFERRSKNCSCTVQPFEMCPHGIGSTMSSMLRPFTQAVLDDVPFDAEGPGHIPLETLGLQPLVEACVRGTSSWQQCKKMVRPNCHFWHWKKVEIQVPPAYQDLGLFWWTAQQWAWLLRPEGTLVAHLDAVKRTLSWETHRPILGMHIRHGDSCMQGEGSRTGRVCEDLHTYLRGAVKMAAYGYRAIYLATDDFAVVQQARADYPAIYWLTAPQATASQLRNKDGGANHRFEQLAYESGEKNMDLAHEFREVLLDVLMLADTDGFVGKFTSNIDRIAYALNFGVRGCAMPFVSLDAYWCNNYAIETGKTVTGVKFAC